MKIKGVWDLERVRRHLDETRVPIRLAVHTASGTPLVLSLWFIRRDDALWCACNRKAQLIDLLRRDPRCGFEVASEIPPYRGVRGQGVATLDTPGGAEVLAALMARYHVADASKLAKMLTAAAADEVAIRIDIDWLTSWDFGARMTGAIQD